MNTAIDLGKKLSDGRRLFGASKTWRGSAGALMTTSLAALWLGYSASTGLAVAFLSLSGDLLSSFIKRRFAMKPESMAPLLDQVPESLLPAIVMMNAMGLTLNDVAVLVITFIIAELALSIMLFIIGVRRHPY